MSSNLFYRTRMHFSRMHTVHCSGHLGGGGAGGVSAQVGGVCLGEGGVCLGGLGGVHLPHGQTDNYENITFPQLLLWTAMITKVTFVMYSPGHGRYRRNSDVVVA